MDLGIRGRRAVVCASSKGLGRGCAEALAAAGCELVMNARGAEALEEAAEAIRDAHGVAVETVAADVTTEEGRARLLDAAGEPDILVTNAGGPPPGMWHDWTREDFLKALDANMLTPIALMTVAAAGDVRARLGAGGQRHLAVGQGADPAARPVQRGAHRAHRLRRPAPARQVAPMGVTINNLLPGIHATARADALDGGVADREGVTLEEARRRREATIPARRYGTPEEFGQACAFLCSVHAGFVVGPELAARRGRDQRDHLRVGPPRGRRTRGGGRSRPPRHAVGATDQKPKTSATLSRLSVLSNPSSGSEL